MEKSILIVVLFFVSIICCVPLAQQKIDNENARLINYEPLSITIDSAKFIQTLNPKMSDYDVIHNNDELHSSNDMMKENFQSGYSIRYYGNVCAGRGIRKKDISYNEPIEILQDYLFLTIEFGAGSDWRGLVNYDLIWNGYYYMTEDVPTVDLVLSFKDLDIRRAFISKNIRFNIAKLKTSRSNKVYIRFLGYDKLLEYNY